MRRRGRALLVLLACAAGSLVGWAAGLLPGWAVLLWAAPVALVFLAFLLAVGGMGDNGPDGRWNSLGGNHPDAHLVPPAPGRAGWLKRGRWGR
jgi:hypothetical protein